MRERLDLAYLESSLTALSFEAMGFTVTYCIWPPLTFAVIGFAYYWERLVFSVALQDFVSIEG